jgi:hypothetical protein
MTKRLMPGRTLACAVVVIVGAWLLTIEGLHARQQTPTQAFNAYRKALATATAYSDLLPFMDSKSRAMVEPMPAATQAKIFELMKKFNDAFTDVAVTKETVTGETAVLELSGKDAKGQAARGSVPMTKEASGWKVGSEKWSSKPQ